jgi:hypothetical protein
VSNVVEECVGDASIEFALFVDLVQQPRLELREREHPAQRVDSLGIRSDEALELYGPSGQFERRTALLSASLLRNRCW